MAPWPVKVQLDWNLWGGKKKILGCWKKTGCILGCCAKLTQSRIRKCVKIHLNHLKVCFFFNYFCC